MLAQKPPETLIAASILSADFSALGKEISQAAAGGADWLHIDVMDNHYVPNLTFGAPLAAAAARVSPLPLDVHLMTERVGSLIAPFAAAGAARLTFHPDADLHAHGTAAAIRAAGMQAGAAINPAQPLSLVEHLLDEVDLVLLMTVNPGFGGQRFIDAMLPKIRALRQMLDRRAQERRERGDDRDKIYLQVDGGINADTAPRCIDAGADVLVAGNFIFNSENYAEAIARLRGGDGGEA